MAAFHPLRTLVTRGTLRPMQSRGIIKWIDKQWDAYPNARNWLGLIVAAGWLPLMIIGWQTTTVTIAVLWGVVWIGLFGWRFFVQFERLDAKSRRRRQR